MRARPFLLLSVGLLCPALAAADVVDGAEDLGRRCPPLRCPPGTNAWSGGHGSCSPGCSPGAVCTPDGRECAEGDSCVERAYCIEEVDLGNSTVDVVRGTCERGGSCAAGRCDVNLRCVHPPERARPPRGRRQASQVGCAVGAAARGPSWACLALALAFRRRRLGARRGAR